MEELGGELTGMPKTRISSLLAMSAVGDREALHRIEMEWRLGEGQERGRSCERREDDEGRGRKRFQR